MLVVHPIDSFDVPELLPYRTMKGQCDHEQQGIFVAEGEKVVRRLLESALEVISVVLPARWVENLRPILKARPETIHAYVAEKPVLEKLTGFSMYQGVLGLARVPKPASLQECLSAAPRPILLAAVDGVSSAENLGGLIRNCAAFGVHSLVVGETTCHPYLRRSVRSSMGTIFKLPFFRSPALAESILSLRDQNIRTIAAHPHTNQTLLSKTNLREDCCLVFGAEGTGLTPAVLSACDEAAVVPMQQGVDSLNVGTAAAVFLYEAARQRGMA